MADFDLAIIGGGINGTGIARDAAGRGLRVLLVEMNDLALRHLLGLVASSSTAACAISSTARSAWCARRSTSAKCCCAWRRTSSGRCASAAAAAGRALAAACCASACSLYDWLGARKLLPAQPHRRPHASSGSAQPLKRIVPLRLRIFRLLGRRRAPRRAQRARCRRARRRHPHPHQLTRAERGDEWELVLNSRGRRQTATARVLVNAAGPWIGEVAETVIRAPLAAPVAAASKAATSWCAAASSTTRGYILQAADGRVVFALPFAERLHA